jgi:6-O-methylguanine DNA methyltransferase, DNA binding domain
VKAGTKPRARSAIAKRDGHRAPEVKVLHEAKSTAFPAGRMLIASPLALQDVIATVPTGRVMTVSVLRQTLARKFDADYACPVTTGIFLRITADAAEEERTNGASDIMPWWRVVRDDGSLFEKLPGGAARQAKLLANEGAAIERVRGVPGRVASVERLAFVPDGVP